ncbi:glycosyltransferase [Rufibacter immobilis]|uniref:Glycosyltransferase n=1 Tax=Rufibacter immobilis TaxID=1348778 RepID=A0A3M9MWM8_9BACT|nr:glycosyltransferase [Rufibacter immobilis]RNI29890.1 glycosyltransferase [Rufibacter immobilis]
MKKKGKVLFITPVLPDANGGGREKRAHQWMTLLSEENTVELFLISPHPAAGGKAEKLVLRYRKWQRWVEWGKALLSFVVRPVKGAFVLFWMPLRPEHKEFLQRRFQDKTYDKILAFRLYTSDFALYVQQLTQTRLLELDLDDIESSTFEKIARVLFEGGRYKEAFQRYMSAVQFKLMEQERLPQCKRIYICSREDQRLVNERFPGAEVQVFPNRMFGVIQPLPKSTANKKVLFVGSLNHYPNEEAVTWFVQQVLRPLRRNDPDWVFQVVGYEASEQLQSFLRREKGVQFLGAIPSLEAAYAEAGMVVAPLHAGGGTKLKVIEAMWYGRPVIATSESVYGLELVPEVHYLPAETAEEHMQQCVKLATSPALYHRLVAQAGALVQEKFSYGAHAAPQIWVADKKTNTA